jgi:hypothetical protein
MVGACCLQPPGAAAWATVLICRHLGQASATYTQLCRRSQRTQLLRELAWAVYIIGTGYQHRKAVRGEVRAGHQLRARLGGGVRVGGRQGGVFWQA